MAGQRRWQKLAILHKIEGTYGTDSAPAAADALIGKNVTFTPMQAQRITRDLMLPYMGNQGVLLAGITGRLEMDIELAGAGSPGDIPKWGSIFRAGGFAETVTEDISVDYTIIEDAAESGSLYFVSDKVRHVLLGGRANIVLAWTASQIPTARISYVGLLGTVTDVGAMPAVSKAGWIDPLIVSKANTVMSLHGWTAVAESLSLDLGAEVTGRFLIGDEYIHTSNRSGTGTAVVEARSMATVDWFAKARSRERDALTLTHGTTAGNIVAAVCPAVEIGEPTQGQTNNVITYSLPLDLCPDEGLDELTITVR